LKLARRILDRQSSQSLEQQSSPNKWDGDHHDQHGSNDDRHDRARHVEKTEAKGHQPHEALVRAPLDPTDGPDPGRHVRLILGEFAAGSVETVNAAITNIFDYLLDHKEKLRTALCAKMGEAKDTSFESLTGKLGEDPASTENRDILDRLILEILRFRPMGRWRFDTAKLAMLRSGARPLKRARMSFSSPLQQWSTRRHFRRIAKSSSIATPTFICISAPDVTLAADRGVTIP
jgi:cytochrome P450